MHIADKRTMPYNFASECLSAGDVFEVPDDKIKTSFYLMLNQDAYDNINYGVKEACYGNCYICLDLRTYNLVYISCLAMVHVLCSRLSIAYTEEDLDI